MKAEIHRLSLGICNCYVIKEEGVILVDTGPPHQKVKFLKKLKNLSIKPEEIALIFLTHGHWDHAGSVNELKKLTGCKVAVNRYEKDWVEKALKIIPPGVNLWGRFLSLVMKILVPFAKFSGTSADLVLENVEFSVEPFGIQGKIIHTPGHSPGSMSLLLDSGEAFVGDLAMYGFPKLTRNAMPLFAGNPGHVKESWMKILNMGARWIYPAHGRRFKADELKKLL